MQFSKCAVFFCTGDAFFALLTYFQLKAAQRFS